MCAYSFHSCPHAQLFLCLLDSLASLLPHSGSLSCSLTVSVLHPHACSTLIFMSSPLNLFSPPLSTSLSFYLFFLHFLCFFVFLLGLWLTCLAVFGFCLSSTSVCVLLCLCGGWVSLAELPQPGSFG